MARTLHAFFIASLAQVIEIEVLGSAFGTEALVVITFDAVLDLTGCAFLIIGHEHSGFTFCADC